MKRGSQLLEQIFYFIGVLILIVTLWTGFGIQWNRLDDAVGSLVFLNLVIGMSVGFTEIAMGWFVGLHIDEKSDS